MLHWCKGNVPEYHVPRENYTCGNHPSTANPGSLNMCTLGLMTALPLDLLLMLFLKMSQNRMNMLSSVIPPTKTLTPLYPPQEKLGYINFL